MVLYREIRGNVGDKVRKRMDGGKRIVNYPFFLFFSFFSKGIDIKWWPREMEVTI